MPAHLPDFFDKKSTPKSKVVGEETGDLQRKVWQLTMEVDFLEKKCKQLEITVKGRNS